MKKIAFAWVAVLLMTFQWGRAEEMKCGADDWNPVTAGPISTWTAPICGRHNFAVQPFLFYNHTRGLFDSEAHENTLTGADEKFSLQQMVSAQIGITEKLELDAQMGYQQNYLRLDGEHASASGLADSFVAARYCAIEDRDWIPHVTGLFQVKLPTGKYQHANPEKLGTDLMGASTGGGSFDPGLGLNLSKKLKPFWLHADLIYNFPIEVDVDDRATQYGQYFIGNFAIELLLPKNLNLMFEVNGCLQQDMEKDGIRISDSGADFVMIAAGVGYSEERVQTLLAYQRVLWGRNVDANDSVVLTVVFGF